MQKVTAIFVILGLVFLCSSAKFDKKDKKAASFWLTMNQMNAQYAKEKKPVLIDLYTDWCGWCKKMDATTYKHDSLSDYLRTKFYAVKFDAESKDSVQWSGRNFVYNLFYKSHDFAIYLTSGNLSYPTTIIIPSDGIPQAISGYLTAKELEIVLKYFGEDYYGKIPWQTYQTTFVPHWK